MKLQKLLPLVMMFALTLACQLRLPAVPLISLPGFHQTPTPALSLRLVDRTIREQSRTPSYTIDIHAPGFEWNTPAPADGTIEAGSLDALNQIIDRILAEQMREFKKNALEMENWRVENLPEASSFLYISYSTTYVSAGLVSLIFSVSMYSVGAAHPGLFTISLNYDINAGRTLALADLFQPGSNYLEVLSTYCRRELEAESVLQFAEGVAPEAENYKSWNIRSDGLLITFDPYQVAPYAMGSQDVVVPYTALAIVLLPDGPLTEIIEQK